MADEEMNLVAWLSERIEARRTLADQVHTLNCDRVSGSSIENLDDSCDCGQPAAVRDSCDAHSVLLAGHGPANGPERWDDDGHPVMGIVCVECSVEEVGAMEPWPCRHVRTVAIAYRRDPGYQERWAAP